MNTKETTFEQATRQIGKEALATVRLRYEQSRYPEFNYGYHDTSHSRFVEAVTKLVLDEIEDVNPRLVDPREYELAAMNSKGHDRFIAWYAQVTRIGWVEIAQMKRLVGHNEKISAMEQKMAMTDKNRQYGEEIFTEEDAEVTDEQIMVTVPGFDPNLKTVIQPNLTPETRLGARVVAMADLAKVGRDHLGFLTDGNKLLREEKLFIYRTLTKLDHRLSTFYREIVRSIILDWTNSQEDFARGRQTVFHQDLLNLPKAARRAVKRLFPEYDLSIVAAAEQAQRRAQMNLVDLLTDTGFLDPTKDPRATLINSSYLI